MKIAIEGCCHGDLDNIYETLMGAQRAAGVKVDLLIICGDFQACRDKTDLGTMSCPDKYKSMCSFYKYYSGEKVAPVTTIFVGGNHEASNHLWELSYGGWVAPHIFFLGNAGVVKYGGIRIAGLSGIYNEHHYKLGHFERPPYNDRSLKSAYHVREYEVFQLSQLSQKLDVFISHDWPTRIAHFGNKQRLISKKRFLEKEIGNNSLGSPPGEELLKKLRPSYWFAAHLHVKFAALVPHPPTECRPVKEETRFLALDKCLPHRDFLQILDFPDAAGPAEIEVDPEWLAVLKSTGKFRSNQRNAKPLPRKGPNGGGQQRWDYTPTEAELAAANQTIAAMGSPRWPSTFERTVEPYDPATDPRPKNFSNLPAAQARMNPQMIEVCAKLGLPNLCSPSGGGGSGGGGGGGMGGNSGPPVPAGFPPVPAGMGGFPGGFGFPPPQPGVVMVGPPRFVPLMLNAGPAAPDPNEINLDSDSDSDDAAPAATDPNEISIDSSDDDDDGAVPPTAAPAAATAVTGLGSGRKRLSLPPPKAASATDAAGTGDAFGVVFGGAEEAAAPVEQVAAASKLMEFGFKRRNQNVVVDEPEE